MAGRRPGQLFDQSPGGEGGQRSSAQYEDGLLSVGPGLERQDNVERVPANDQGVYRGEELLIAVRDVAAW